MDTKLSDYSKKQQNFVIFLQKLGDFQWIEWYYKSIKL
jgi:hypothetical protein